MDCALWQRLMCLLTIRINNILSRSIMVGQRKILCTVLLYVFAKANQTWFVGSEHFLCIFFRLFHWCHWNWATNRLVFYMPLQWKFKITSSYQVMPSTAFYKHMHKSGILAIIICLLAVQWQTLHLDKYVRQSHWTMWLYFCHKVLKKRAPLQHLT